MAKLLRADAWDKRIVRRHIMDTPDGIIGWAKGELTDAELDGPERLFEKDDKHSASFERLLKVYAEVDQLWFELGEYPYGEDDEDATRERPPLEPAYFMQRLRDTPLYLALYEIARLRRGLIGRLRDPGASEGLHELLQQSVAAAHFDYGIVADQHIVRLLHAEKQRLENMTRTADGEAPRGNGKWLYLAAEIFYPIWTDGLPIEECMDWPKLRGFVRGELNPLNGDLRDLLRLYQVRVTDLALAVSEPKDGRKAGHPLLAALRRILISECYWAFIANLNDGVPFSSKFAGKQRFGRLGRQQLDKFLSEDRLQQVMAAREYVTGKK